MGLDWIIESKPIAGHDKEFSRIKKELKKLK